MRFPISWVARASSRVPSNVFLFLVTLALNSMKLYPASLQASDADVVLPTPGGPESRAALNMLPSSRKRRPRNYGIIHQTNSVMLQMNRF